MALNLGNASKISLSQPDDSSFANKIDKGKVGYRLCIFLLCIVGAYVLFLVLYLLFSHSVISDPTAVQLTNLNDTILFNQRIRILENLQKQQTEKTSTLIQISQMVLLNVCLPLLTAILGYIFGSSTPGTTEG